MNDELFIRGDLNLGRNWKIELVSPSSGKDEAVWRHFMVQLHADTDISIDITIIMRKTNSNNSVSLA